MRVIRIPAFYLLILAIALSPRALYARDVSIGLFFHQPNVHYDEMSGEARGPLIDYLNAVFSHMGYTAHIRVLPIVRLFRELREGTLDAAADLSWAPEREEFLLYADKPSLLIPSYLAVRSDSPLFEVKSPRELSGKTIGFLSGAAAGNFFLDAKDIRFEYVSGDSWVLMNLLKLISGRIDAALDQNPWSYRVEAIKLGIEDRIRLIELPSTPTGFYVVFSRKAANAEVLLSEYNRVHALGLYDERAMLEAYMQDLSGQEKAP